MTATWEDRVSGRTCPFDRPRADYDDQIYLVRKLSVSSLFLARNQTYRGHCMLIFDLGHVLRIDQLSPEAWAAQATDIKLAQTAVFAAVAPDHINVASLGNVVPHLHWHIVPRYKNDPRWGDPIWTPNMPTTRLAESEYAELAAKIAAAVDRQIRAG